MIDRGRLTERVSWSLVKIELRRALRPLVVISVGFLVAILCGSYIRSNIEGGVGSTHQIRFEVADATGVVPERAEVRFKGIEAGRVDAVKLRDGRAVLTANVADKFGPVYRDAKIALRPNTALQDMYVDVLDRGTPAAGKASSSDVIGLQHTTSPVNLADVLNTFNPSVRAHLYDLLDQFGNGLEDRGESLRRAFAAFIPFLRDVGGISRQLGRRADLTRSLVHNTGVLSGTLAKRDRQLRTLIRAGATTLEAASARNGADLQATIHELPKTLASIDSAFTAVDGTLPAVNRAAGALRPVARDLPESLAGLRSIAKSADPAIRALRPPVADLMPLARQLRPLAGSLDSAFTALSPQIKDVDHISDSLAKCSKKKALYTFFNWTSSVIKWRDAYGWWPRGDFGFGLDTSYVTKDPNVHDLENCAGPKHTGGPTGATWKP